MIKFEEKNRMHMANNEMFDSNVLFKNLFNYKYIFLLSIILFTLIGFLYIRYTQPKFLVKALILITDENEGNISSDLSVLQDLNLMSGTKKSIYNEIGILKSRTLLENVLSDNKLNISYYSNGTIADFELYGNDLFIRVNYFIEDSFIKEMDTTFYLTAISEEKFIIENEDRKIINEYTFGSNIGTDFGEINVLPANLDDIRINETIKIVVEPMNSVVDRFMKKINISPDNVNSNLIRLEMKHPVKMKAEDIINFLIEKYNTNAINFKAQITKNTDEFIDARIGDVSLILSEADVGIEEFKIKNRLTDIGAEASLDLSIKAELEKEIIDLSSKVQLMDYVERYIIENENELIPSNLWTEDERTNQNTIAYNSLLLEKNRILRGSSARNPTVINLDLQIRSMRVSILQSIKNLKSSYQFALSEAKGKDYGLRSKKNIAPQQEREFKDIIRKQTIVETLYLYLLQKKEENAITMGVPFPSAKIIDRAQGSNKPISPKKLFVYLFSIVFGFALPFSILYLKFVFDNKIHAIEDLKRYSLVPVIGEIPKASFKKDNFYFKSNSPIAEALRILRSNLDFVLPNTEKSSKTIFVTSTIAGEGKTFISINLAKTIALADKKVILIGTDLRKPKLGKYLDLGANNIGLTNFLTDPKILVEDLVNSIGEDNFDVIQSGPIPPNPSELLMNKRFKEIVDYCVKNYEYVLFDTAPLQLVTDTLLISEYADLVLFIVRSNTIERQMLDTVNNLFDQKRFNKIYFLMNETKKKKNYYGYS